MATVPRNLFLYDVAGHKAIPYAIDKTGSNDINQGDLLYWDSSAKQVKPLDTDGHAATFAGMADDGSFVQPYSAKKYADAVMVRVGCVVLLNTVSGDTFSDGDAVYYSTDAQTCTKVAGTNIIGYAKLPPGKTSLVGGTGVQVPVLLVPKSPVTPIV